MSHSTGPDSILARKGSRQRGLVTIEQLRDTGLTDGAVTRRCGRGSLHRIHRGVYALGHRGLSREGWAMAAVLAAGDGAALSHLSAAALYRAWRRAVRGIDVTAPRRRVIDGVRLHLCRRMDPRDVTTYRGIPVTTLPRTLVDLSDVLTVHQLANVIHEAAFRGLLHLEAVGGARGRATGRRNLHVLDQALADHASGSAGTRSDLEDTVLSLVEQLDLSQPLVNVPFKTATREIEVDFRWPEANLCVEVDGPGHRRPRTRREDAKRDAELTAAGQRVLRFDDSQIETDLDGVGRILVAAVHRDKQRPAPSAPAQPATRA